MCKCQLAMNVNYMLKTVLFDCLFIYIFFQDLPDTIHIGGRISPHTVWDYVGKLKTSLSKVRDINKCY